MSVYNKVQAVEKVFRHLEKELSSFQIISGMHCTPNCGKCCTKPDISATVLEFLPLAYHLFKTGRALDFYHTLKTSESSVCTLLSPFRLNEKSGFCSIYPYRGLICRLFGFSSILNKNGERQLITCSVIKSELPLSYKNGVQLASEGRVVLMRDYYFRLAVIDPDLGREHTPVNVAIKKALEYILAYYSYRRPRKAG